MRFAYADPPYHGCAVRLYGDHPDAAVYDTLDGHRALIDRLVAEFPDGWALSMSATNLRDLLPFAPSDVRVCAWVKGWCSWKPNNYPAYAWEPVLLYGGRKPASGDKTWDTARDWMMCNVATNMPVKGAKPRAFCEWVFSLLGLLPGDDLVDLFPGSGAVTETWEAWRQQLPFVATVDEPLPLEAS
jgi:hypothetical protein